MIDEKELKAWIARLETEQSSWPNYEKLAALYIIQNQHEGQRNPAPVAMYSSAPAPDVVEGKEMDNQVKMAAALFMMLTTEQKDVMLDLVESLLLEQAQCPFVEE